MEGLTPKAVVVDEVTMTKMQINAEEQLRAEERREVDLSVRPLDEAGEKLKQEATDILARGLALPFNWLRFDEEDFLKRESASKVGKPRSAKNRAKSRADGKKARAARRNNR